jgi:hypothetical protein
MVGWLYRFKDFAAFTVICSVEQELRHMAIDSSEIDSSDGCARQRQQLSGGNLFGGSSRPCSQSIPAD